MSRSFVLTASTFMGGVALVALALLGAFSFGGGAPDAAFADEASCDAVHVSLTYDIGSDECRLDVAITLNGTFALDHTLHIQDQGKITTNTAAGLTLNIDGAFIIDTPFGATGTNGISGDVVNAFGRPITINTTENVLLRGNGTKGAAITSSRTGLSDAPGGGGAITINAGPRVDGRCTDPLSGNITMEPGSRVVANTSKATAGTINMDACRTMDIDGLVESSSAQTGSGTATIKGGGPINLIAGCTLTVSDTGKVSSRSLDPRGDRVHLQGCDVFIYGIVESVAKGHANPQGDNGCKGAARPSKPNGAPLPNYPYTNYSSNCVEIWGKTITIDASGAHNGQVNADSGGGGNGGTGWIELDARQNITLIGCSTTVAGDCSPDYYLVHANGLGGSGAGPGEGSLGGEEGGLINVTSTTGGLTASGLVFSAFAGNQGSNSDGGSLIIETNTNTGLGSSVNDVGGADLRGITSAKSFNGTVLGVAPGLLDTCGSALGATDGDNTCVPAVPATPRLVKLQGCGPNNLPGPPNDGVSYTGTSDPTPFTQPNDQCGGAPVPDTQNAILSDCQRCGVVSGPASKSGVKFEDVNANGIKDIGEPLLAGWTINLYADDNPQNGDLDAAEFAGGADLTDTTDAAGFYEFPLLPPGSYIVCEVLPADWFQSSPSGGTAECDGNALLASQGYAITLVADQHDTDNDFGNYKKAKKCGYKFHDLDADGVWDDGEPVLSGWTIHLSGQNGLGQAVSGGGSTGDDGKYCFTLVPGTYTVCESLQAGPPAWFQSYPDPGTSGSACSSVAGYGPHGYTVTLTSGQQDLDNNFGNYKNARKCGVKFRDDDANGYWNDGEPSVTGWVIHMFGLNGQGNPIHLNTTTDGDNGYCFSIPPGTWTVCEEQKSGWLQTYPNSTTTGKADCTGHTDGATFTPAPWGWAVTLTSGQEDLNNHFGNFQLGTSRVETELHLEQDSCLFTLLGAQPMACLLGVNETVVAVGSTVPLNSVLHDKATVSVSGVLPPTGSVSFAFYDNSDCVDDPVFTSSVALDGASPGLAHPSQSTSPLTPGAWAFQATWAGDIHYAGNVSDCEWFLVAGGGQGQGCTPGFWHNKNGGALWDESPDADWTAAGGAGNPPFLHDTLFNSFFSAHADLNGVKMIDLVSTGGGPNPVRKAARSIVAAYLNSSIGLNYPFTPAQLIAAWNDANDGDDSDGEFLALHEALDDANNLHNNNVCPQDDDA